MDRKKLVMKVAAGLLITSIVTLGSVLATSPGLAQVLANFNWLYALRAFTAATSVGAAGCVLGVGLGVDNKTTYKWHAFAGFSVLMIVCITAYAGLWR